MSVDSEVERLRLAYGDKGGTELISALRQEYGREFGVISSFGIESAVLLDLVAQVDRAIPVIFLDTSELFDETHAYRATLAAKLGLTDLRHVRPDPASLVEAEELWQTAPDRCCHLRKVVPLYQAAEGFKALIDGRKRFHGDDRSAIQTIEAGDRGIVKVSPLARWSEAEIAETFRARQLPLHPLALQGYRSVGCWPCSRPSLPGEGPRAGRWAGSAKTECGIHLSHVEEAAQ